MTGKLGDCVCCRQPAKGSIQLAAGPDGPQRGMIRYYLPNEFVRNEVPEGASDIQEVSFCATCMRTIEDNLRATILYLRAENGVVAVKPTGKEGAWE